MNKRITAHDESYGGYKKASKFCQNSAVLRKLGRLEDIEEELGIDLITVLKARQMYLKTMEYTGYCDVLRVVLNEEATYPYVELRFVPKGKKIAVVRTFYFKHHYGIKFAMTREELENE